MEVVEIVSQNRPLDPTSMDLSIGEKLRDGGFMPCHQGQSLFHRIRDEAPYK